MWKFVVVMRFADMSQGWMCVWDSRV